MRDFLQVIRLGAPLLLAILPFAVAAFAQDGEPSVPADYLAGKVSDPVSKLVSGLEAGTVKLAYEPQQGYLRSLLRALDIPVESQVLVFSKTSFQSPYISPTNPRALYFSDRAYVGWIRGAPYMEVVGIDPKYGPVFFTLDNRSGGIPNLARKTYDCLQCHDTPMTMQVPGLMARSVYPGPDGTPRLTGGSFQTTAASPMKERWGGWYVTGSHGGQRHMGNQVARGDDANPVIDSEAGANVTDLSRYFDVVNYLTPHSDIVALMIAEQQMEIQNLITKTATLTRAALNDAAVLRQAGWDADHVEKGLQSRVDHACEPLVRALLCAEEPALTEPIKGSSKFTAVYSGHAPADGQGRRLSQLDLSSRLLKYSCSPMIYSASFADLPVEARTRVLQRIREVLGGTDGPKPFQKLSASDKEAILQILSATLPEFASTTPRQGSRAATSTCQPKEFPLMQRLASSNHHWSTSKVPSRPAVVPQTSPASS